MLHYKYSPSKETIIIIDIPASTLTYLNKSQSSLSCFKWSYVRQSLWAKVKHQWLDIKRQIRLFLLLQNNCICFQSPPCSFNSHVYYGLRSFLFPFLTFDHNAGLIHTALTLKRWFFHREARSQQHESQSQIINAAGEAQRCQMHL